ncbi:MAG TPA: putative porin [Verrucomicrobiae bacterium]|nr:putative porin [Verrucomicrobiae bacterium]
MKKIKRTNTSKIALFAGATALMAMAPQIHAQTSGDALINKLEQKGILSSDEARELRAENAQDFNSSLTNDITSTLPKGFGAPGWITGYKLSGDLRGRYDQVSTDLPAFGGHDNNIRLRYRLRVGLTVNMADNMQLGFRLGSDDSPGTTGGTTGGNPLSNNTTLQGNGSKKFIYVDAAYGKWTPIKNDTWTLSGTIGKMDQPLVVSPMLFDPDYTPEGGALQATYKINDMNSLAFNGVGFVLDQVNSRSPFLYGGQAIWNANWTPKITSSAGIAFYDIVNSDNLAANATGTPYDSNRGNTLTGTGAFASDFNPIVASGSATYTLDSFPLYTGAFPIKLAGEYMNNPAASSQNEGWWAGVTFGKSGKKGNWDISYRYQRLEADAWWDQLVDDDNIAVFPTSATAGAAAGGTNIKGHLVKMNYSIFDSLTFTFTCYVNDLINNPIPGTKTGAVHAMADLMWKF